MAAAKLGLLQADDDALRLRQDLHGLLHAAEVDMTLWYRALSKLDPSAPSLAPFDDAFYDAGKRAAHEDALRDWLQRYAACVATEARSMQDRRAAMDAVNPRYVLRNYLAQQVIDRAESGDAAGIAELLDVLRRPYDDQPGRDAFAARRPDWARDRAGCSMLSCSS